MTTRFLIFVSVVVSFLGVSAFYVGERILTWSYWADDHRSVIWLTLSLFVLLQVLGPVLYRLYPRHMNRLFMIHWITYTSLGVFACMLFYTLAADLLLRFGSLFVDLNRFVDFERRSFLVASILALGSAIIGFIQATAGPRIYEVEIPLANLPAGLNGFKIAQISDLHIGPTIRRNYAKKVVKMINGLAPDLVALTGDLVDGSVAQLRRAVEPLGEIKAKHGMFFVTGNHEYYWGAQKWIEEFRRLGARVLLNEHAVISKNGHELVVAGIADPTAGQLHASGAPDPARAVHGAPQEAIKILLAHQPAVYKEASRAGVHLQLSGHTHGGQFFPWNIVVALVHRYYKGLRKHENMWVYVSRGAGYWGPPLRFGVPAEITLLRLKRADSALHLS